MEDVTRILQAIDNGEPQASDKLLPLVYDELRKLASAKLSRENSSQTWAPTALVHEAYLRLVDGKPVQNWNSRGHFFGAAAEAMRRILVENARHKSRLKHGGQFERQELDLHQIVAPGTASEILALSEALDRLATQDPQSAELVKLRFFAGLTIPQIAQILNVSPRKADMIWSFARAWLRREMERN